MASNSTTDQQKKALRAQALTARSRISEKDRIAAGLAVAKRIMALPAVNKSRTIAVYEAVNDELSLAPTIEALYEARIRVAYPCLRGDHLMEFHVVEKGERPTFIVNPIRVYATSDATTRLSASEIDLVLAPGVAFDERCNRLGYGGGYYDAFIPSLPSESAIIGIAYDEQIVEEVPHITGDRRVHYVITPTRMLLP